MGGAAISDDDNLGGGLRNIDGDFFSSALGRGLSCKGCVVGIGDAGSFGFDEFDLGGGEGGNEEALGVTEIALELRASVEPFSLRGMRVNNPCTSWVSGESSRWEEASCVTNLNCEEDCAGGLLLGGLSRSAEGALGGVDTGVGSTARSRSSRCCSPSSEESVRSTYLLQLATFCAVRGECALDGGVSSRLVGFFEGEGECLLSAFWIPSPTTAPPLPLGSLWLRRSPSVLEDIRSRLFDERKDCLLLVAFLSRVCVDSLVSMLGWRVATADGEREAGREEAEAGRAPRKKESRFESEDAAAYL